MAKGSVQSSRKRAKREEEDEEDGASHVAASTPARQMDVKPSESRADRASKRRKGNPPVPKQEEQNGEEHSGVLPRDIKPAAESLAGAIQGEDERTATDGVENARRRVRSNRSNRSLKKGDTDDEDDEVPDVVAHISASADTTPTLVASTSTSAQTSADTTTEEKLSKPKRRKKKTAKKEESPALVATTSAVPRVKSETGHQPVAEQSAQTDVKPNVKPRRRAEIATFKIERRASSDTSALTSLSDQETKPARAERTSSTEEESAAAEREQGPSRLPARAKREREETVPALVTEEREESTLETETPTPHQSARAKREEKRAAGPKQQKAESEDESMETPESSRNKPSTAKRARATTSSRRSARAAKQERSRSDSRSSSPASVQAYASPSKLRRAVKQEEPPAVKAEVVDVTADATESVSRASRYTRDQKGKGREVSHASSGSADDDAKENKAPSTAEREKRKLREEMKALREELRKAHATADTTRATLSSINNLAQCNVCLEVLKNPLALACGHVFCQDDLWNWFHRTEGEETDSDDDFDDDDDMDEDGAFPFSEDDDPIGRANLDDMFPPRPGRLGAGGRRSVPARSENAREVDSSSDEEHAQQPDSQDGLSGDDHARRGYYHESDDGDRGEASNAENDGDESDGMRRAARGFLDRLANAQPGSPAGPRVRPVPAHLAGTASRAPAAREATQANGSAPPPPAAPGRIPARARPNRRNLTCPECRTRVSIPPFPVFIVRQLSHIVAVSTTGRRAQSVEGDRDDVTDPTWGGLFPRSAGAATNAGRGAGARPADDQGRIWHVPLAALDVDDGGVNEAEDPFDYRERRQLTGAERRAEAQHETINRATAERQLRQVNYEIQTIAREIRGLTRTGRRGGSDADRADRMARMTALQARRQRLLDIVHQPRPRGRNAPGAETGRGRDVLRRGIRDGDDGVRRCIECNWEIERNECGHCGALYDSDSEFGDDGDEVDTQAESESEFTQSRGRLASSHYEGSDIFDDTDDDERAPRRRVIIEEDEDEEGRAPQRTRTVVDITSEGEDHEHPLVQVLSRNLAARHTRTLDSEDDEAVRGDAESGEEDEEEGLDLLEDPASDEDESGTPATSNHQDRAQRHHASRRAKRNRYMYSSDESVHENEFEEDGFLAREGDPIEMMTDEEDEMELAAERIHAQRKQRKREARERQLRDQGAGPSAALSSSPGNSSSIEDPDEDEEEEEVGEQESMTTPPSDMEEEEEEDLETIGSQKVVREVREQLRASAGRATLDSGPPRSRSKAAENAARAAMARARGQQATQAGSSRAQEAEIKRARPDEGRRTKARVIEESDDE